MFISQKVCTIYLEDKEKNAVTLPHSTQRKHTFLVKIKQIPKSRKIAPRKKAALELLHHRLGHRYTRSLMSGDNANICQDIELRINPDPFCTSCQISSINKKVLVQKFIKTKVIIIIIIIIFITTIKGSAPV